MLLIYQWLFADIDYMITIEIVYVSTYYSPFANKIIRTH